MLLTWVTGGNPVGDLEHAPPPVTLHSDARLGTPDLELPLSEVTLPADTPERTQEFSLPTAAWSSRWVRAVDFVPGTPAIVRSATVFVKPRRRPLPTAARSRPSACSRAGSRETIQ